MGQPIRRSYGKDRAAYWEALRDRMNAGAAVDLLNSVITEDEDVVKLISMKKINTSMFFAC